MAKQLYSKAGLTETQLENRALAMADVLAFVGLIAPSRVLGHCHKDMLKFIMNEEQDYQLVLWPRGHQKSTMLAYWAAWWIINNPHGTLLYASATADLAEKQLTFIKDILQGPIVAKYWPELLVPEVGQRTMWRMDEIAVDHPKRKEEAVRDPTIKSVGMGANITGFHADVVLLDDIVVKENAYSRTERDKVKSWYSLLNSILNPGGFVKVVGTRYHPDDLYNELIEMEEEQYTDEGEHTGDRKVYVSSINVVEVDGQFLWPKQRRPDGRWFGFDKRELSRIKAQYLDKAQFFAQYYNDPSDPLNRRIDNFLYYEKEQVKLFEGRYCINGKPLNVYAAIDFAATVTSKADYTAIVVAGVDCEHNIFVLDIDRFRTDKISVMVDQLEKLFDKWRWIKLRAECNAQQNLVVEQIKEHNKNRGIFYSIDKIPSVGNKEIRIMTNLEPRYAAGKVYHYRGGNCQILEDELMATRPPHDDVSDALAAVVEIATAPMRHRKSTAVNDNVIYHPKFGGVY